MLSRGAVILSVLVTSSASSITAPSLSSGSTASSFVLPPVLSTAGATRFAVIGDYGYASESEQAVASMVSGWNPDFIITVGDNNYDKGAAATIDANIGQYYRNYIYPYTGGFTPTATITQNLFFPSLGNHDWADPSAAAYLNYFTLPGNERYYDFIWGPAHFLAIDSDPSEPDGITRNSMQAVWLERQLAFSSAKWRLVYMHHPPYSSGAVHGSTLNLQWPYQSWGATAILAGHEHTYERIIKNGLAYFVDGVGGRSLYSFSTLVSGSAFRFASNYGAMLVTADEAQIKFEFYTITDTLHALDTYTVTVPSMSNRVYFPLNQK